MKSSVGQQLKALRKGKKLTQEQVADKLGISRSSIANYEIGRRSPNLNDLKQFAVFYGVSLDYFGVASVDEVFELISRAKKVFDNEDIPTEAKEDVYRELMRLYLNLTAKGDK